MCLLFITLFIPVIRRFAEIKNGYEKDILILKESLEKPDEHPD